MDAKGRRGGAAINATDEEGWQAMHIAAVHGHASVTELLIGQGASVKADGELVGGALLEAGGLGGKQGQAGVQTGAATTADRQAEGSCSL